MSTQALSGIQNFCLNHRADSKHNIATRGAFALGGAVYGPLAAITCVVLSIIPFTTRFRNTATLDDHTKETLSNEKKTLKSTISSTKKSIQDLKITLNGKAEVIEVTKAGTDEIVRQGTPKIDGLRAELKTLQAAKPQTLSDIKNKKIAIAQTEKNLKAAEKILHESEHKLAVITSKLKYLGFFKNIGREICNATNLFGKSLFLSGDKSLARVIASVSRVIAKYIPCTKACKTRIEAKKAAKLADLKQQAQVAKTAVDAAQAALTSHQNAKPAEGAPATDSLKHAETQGQLLMLPALKQRLTS